MTSGMRPAQFNFTGRLSIGTLSVFNGVVAFACGLAFASGFVFVCGLVFVRGLAFGLTNKLLFIF